MQFHRQIARLRERAEQIPWVARLVTRHGQGETPYADGVLRQSLLQWLRAQAPGHGGRSLPRKARRLLRRFLRYDVSVMWGVDIAKAVGVLSPLRMAERLCAKLFGAKIARFVTTGATHAAQAAVTALLEHAGRGCTIVVQGSVHISIIDALARAGVRVVFIPPKLSPLGLATVLDPDALERAFKKYPEIGGVIINVVSYEGAVAETRRLVDIAHRHNVPLVADQSWCTELGLSLELPESALQAGADIVIASPHKTLRAAGQSAWVLLGKESLINDINFGAAVREHLSTSKSSVLLALLDIARRDVARNGARMIYDAIRAVEAGEDRLRRAGLGHLIVDWGDVKHIPYRVVFDLRRTGYTGYQVAVMLRKRGVQVAQANVGFICCGFGLGAVKSIRAIFRAMERVGRKLPKDQPPRQLPRPPLEEEVVDFSDVPLRRWELVPIDEAVGRRAKFPLGGYPPGFCVLKPGAVIRKKHVKYLKTIFALGATPFGPPDEVPAGYIAVICE